MSTTKTATAGAQQGGRAMAGAPDQPCARPADGTPGPTSAGRPTPLRRNLQFQTLWVGTTASTLGVSVADVAYPLAILAITRSPAMAGLFAAVQAVGMLVAGLPAGSLSDRYDRRTIVVVTEAARASVTAAVVVALITGWLSLPVLLTAAALLGTGQAVKGAASLPLLRSVVPQEQLTQALTQDEVRMNGAALAGPAIGGALYGVRALSHALPFVFTAAGFLIALAGAALMTIMPGGGEGGTQAGPAPRPGSEPPAAETGGMLTGLRMLWGQPVLRATTLLIMFVNTIGAGLELVIIVLLRHQAVSSPAIGLALGAGAAGGLVGAPLVKVLHRLRPGVLLLALCMLDVLVLALLAVPFGPWWVAGLLFTVMLGVPAIRVLADILVIRQTPPQQRGRVVAALMTLIGLGIPAGVAGCGLLLQYLPAQVAMLILAGTEAIGVAYGATRRELRRAEWPTEHAA